MRMRIATLLLVSALVPAVSRAQDPHFGVGLNLVIPTGGFSSTTYPPNADILTPQREEYDLGLGAQFFVSFPVDPHFAFRLEFSGQSESGSNRAEGYETIHLRHNMFSIAAQAQLFLGTGNAYRHKGSYLLGGISADFERFNWSYDDSYYNDDYDYYYDNWHTEKKNRMGAQIGFGHAFGYGGGGRFTVEAVYHKTLSSHDIDAGEPPSTDFLRLGFGWVF
jgi:hypothetical protein